MTVAADRRLWVWGVFGGLIAMAGLPIYIHAPKFFVDQYGVSLAALGLVLAALRLVDVVQDPVLGWLAGITRARRGLWVAGAAGAMALGMVIWLRCRTVISVIRASFPSEKDLTDRILGSNGDQRKITPGFISPCGSQAAFRALIAAISASERHRCSSAAFARPTPCSALMEPP